MVFKLRRIRPTIPNFRIFLGKKGEDIRRSLRAGEKCIWKSKRLPTKEFEEHWQLDLVFQNLFTGYDSLILQLLDSGITAFCENFEPIRIYFDDQWDVFDNLSLDIDDLPEDERVKIQTPDVKRWQAEWKRMTTNYALPDGDQNYDYDIILARRTKRGWAWNRVSSREDPQNTIVRQPLQSLLKTDFHEARPAPGTHDHGWSVTVSADPTSALRIIAENGDDDNATLQVQGVNDLEHAKGSDAGSGADADTTVASTNNQATSTVELTQEVLDNVSKLEKRSIPIQRWRASVQGPSADEDEDEEGWSHVSDGSLGDNEPDSTNQSDKVETRSMASH